MRFPALTGRSLSGTRVRVPQDLPDPCILLLAFKQWQQRDIDAWIAVLHEADVSHFVELPMLGGKWQPFRPVIDGGMAANIHDADVRDRTITVYGQIGPVEAALSLPSRDQVYAVCVRGGEVAAMRAGPPADARPVIDAYLR